MFCLLALEATKNILVYIIYIYIKVYTHNPPSFGKSKICHVDEVADGCLTSEVLRVMCK